MIKNGFYLIKQEYIDLIDNIGGKYSDNKQRPVYCCVKDKYINNLFWAIPTSDLSHRTQKQINRYNKYINLSNKDIRSAYYHIGYTNRPALYKISNCFPITDKYIEREYISQGKPLCLKNKQEIEAIESKLFRILSYEGRFPNKLEQHITDIKNHLVSELLEIKQNKDFFSYLEVTPEQVKDLQLANIFFEERNSESGKSIIKINAADKEKVEELIKPFPHKNVKLK